MIKFLMELFKKFWVKIVVEVILVFVMWLFYFISKHFLPKKYRIKDATLKEFLKSIGVVLANSPKSDDSVLSIVSKSKALFEHFQGIEMILPNSTKELQKLVAEMKEDIVEARDYNFMTLVFPKLELFGKQELIVKVNDQETIVHFTFEVEKQTVHFYVIRSQNPHSDSQSYNKTFAYSKNFKYRQLTNLLFETTDNKLYLSAKNSDKLITEKLEMDFNQMNYIVDQKIYDELLSEIQEFKNRNIQRSYILNGPPGTGKTSFCLEISRRVSGKILKIDSNTFNNLASGAVKTIIENLTCDFIIVDDIDRIHPSDLSAFLYMLEQVKSFKNKPTLLATVNDITRLDQAAIRPGRFDGIIEFDNPEPAERKAFLVEYLKKVNVTVSQSDLDKLVEATDGMSQAYLKEYCFQLSIENNVPKIITKIEQRKKYLKIMSNERITRYEDDYEEDYDDDPHE